MKMKRCTRYLPVLAPVLLAAALALVTTTFAQDDDDGEVGGGGRTPQLIIVDANGNEIGPVLNPGDFGGVPLTVLEENGIACGLMLRTSYLESLGSYDAGKRVFEDKDLFKRLHIDRIYHLPVPLYNYVRHGESLTDTMVGKAHPVAALSQRETKGKA